LDATLERDEPNNDPRGYGLFQLNIRDQCPLWLSLEGGADIVVVLEHMRRKHPLYLKEHAKLLSKIMAEYSTDMAPLEELVQEDPTFFNDDTNDVPLHYACYYQNPSMIHFLLQHYLRRGDKRKKLLKRLMTNSNSKKTNQRDTPTSITKAPLTYLVQGVGRSDPGNSIECIQACRDSLGNISVLHYAVEEALWPDGDQAPPMTTQQCLQTVQRIMDHWQIDLFSLDDKKRTILSLLIMKQSMAAGNTIIDESIRAILEHILMRCPELAFVRDKRKRLPLHLGCEVGWLWTNQMENDEDNPPRSSSINERKHQEVLEQLVQANPLALVQMDPKAKLYPFALATDLTTIYNLLRYQPGVLAAYR